MPIDAVGNRDLEHQQLKSTLSCHFMIEKLTKESAFHYTWGGNCEAWAFVQSDDLRVVREYMPPGGKEVMHLHSLAQQFFYVLHGSLTMVIDGGDQVTVSAGEGLRIPPGVPHQACNASNSGVEFLVIAQPSTARDRVEIVS